MSYLALALPVELEGEMVPKTTQWNNLLFTVCGGRNILINAIL